MDVNAIFGAVSKYGCRVILLDQRGKKAAQLRDIQAHLCGNCSHWMTSSCVPEKKHKQFKSAASIGCKDFHQDRVGGLIEKFTAELAEIDKRISEFNSNQPHC